MKLRITAEHIAEARAYAAKYARGEPAIMPSRETPARRSLHAAHRREAAVANFARAAAFGRRAR